MLSIMYGILMSIHFHNEILMLGAEGGEYNASVTGFFIGSAKEYSQVVVSFPLIPSPMLCDHTTME